MLRGSPPKPVVSSLVIVGADTVLAALPATPVQLAHACRALGYDMAVPASWGDELIAASMLEQLALRGREPLIMGTCPHVVERLTRSGGELAPWMLTSVAPPVATARYLRAVCGDRPVHITYVGACPAATDPVIDRRLAPAELFAAFAERGIVPTEQPELFESVLPPDRRRFYSLPGGVPTAQHVSAVDSRRTVVELEGDQVLLELAEQLLAREHALIDLAPQLGCACSGVLVPGAAHGARSALAALEPPRASAPVVDHSVSVSVARATPDLPVSAVGPAADAADTHSAGSSAPGARGDDPNPLASSDHRAPRSGALHRCASSTMPQLRRPDGALIPRAYAGHRRPRPTHATAARASRSSARGPVERAGALHRATELSPHRTAAPPPPAPIAPAARATRSGTNAPAGDPPPPLPPPPARRRSEILLGLVTAVGLALSTAGETPRRAPTGAQVVSCTVASREIVSERVVLS
jgi:hypothetical protein